MSRSLLVPATRICPLVVWPLVFLAATIFGQVPLAAQSNQSTDSFSSKFLNRGAVPNKSRTTVVKVIESSPLSADAKPIVSVKTVKRATNSTARRATVKPKRFKNEFIAKKRAVTVPQKSADVKETKPHPFRQNPANAFEASPRKDEATRPAFESPFGDFQPLERRRLVAGAEETISQPPVEVGSQEQSLPTADNDANVSSDTNVNNDANVGRRKTTKVVELDLSQSGEKEDISKTKSETVPVEQYEGPMPGAMSSASVSDLNDTASTESQGVPSDQLKPEEAPSQRVAALPASEFSRATTPALAKPVGEPKRPQIESGPNSQPSGSRRFSTATDRFAQEDSRPQPDEKIDVPAFEQDEPSIGREAQEQSELDDLDAGTRSEEENELDDDDYRSDPYTDAPRGSDFSNSWPSRSVYDIGIDIRERSSVVPPDRSGELISDGGGDWGAFSTAPKNFAWAAPNIRYQPLYLEDVALERYGQTPCGWAEAVVSYAHFFKSTALLPYSMLKECPHSCDSPLGYCRPGAAAPKIIQRHFWR